MSKFYQQLGTVVNVASPGIAVLQLDPTLTYDSIHIPYLESAAAATIAAIAAAITSVKVIRNGKQVIEWTGAELQIRNATMDSVGWAARDGFIDIFFGLPKVFSQEARLATAWGMEGVDSLHIELTIASGRTSPSFNTPHAWKWPVRKRDTAIIYNGRHTINPAIGTNTVDNLPTEDGDYVAIHHTTANIDDLTVKMNGSPMIDALTRSELGVWLARTGNFAQNAAWTSMMFIGSGLWSDRLGMKVDGEAVNSFRLIPNMSASTAHTIHYELYGKPVGGI